MEARLLGQIKPFIVMEVLERANELQNKVSISFTWKWESRTLMCRNV